MKKLLKLMTFVLVLGLNFSTAYAAESGKFVNEQAVEMVAYTVNHIIVEGDINITFQTEEKEGEVDTAVTPEISSVLVSSGYTTPELQTIVLSSDASKNIVNYYYELIVEEETSYYVNHYVYDPNFGEFRSVNLGKHIGKFAGDEITVNPLSAYELSLLGYDGTLYEIPDAQTKIIKEDGTTTFSFYYNKVSAHYYVRLFTEASADEVKNVTSSDVVSKKEGKIYIAWKNNIEKLTGKIGDKADYGVIVLEGYTPQEKIILSSEDGCILRNDNLFIDIYYDKKISEKTAINSEHTVENITYKILTDYSVSATAINQNGTVVIPSTVEINNTTYKVTEISANAFLNNKKIKSVTIPASIKTIGSKAFKNCTALSKVTIKGSGLASIGNSAFEGCKKLKSFTITANVKKIGSKAFNNCKSLSKVTIKGAKLKSIGTKAFNGIKKNATFKCPKKKLASYKKMLSKSKIGYKKTWKIK